MSFACRHLRPALAEHRFVLLRQLIDEVVRVRGLCRLDDLRRGRVQLPVPDVLEDRARKQLGILQDDAHLFAKGSDLQVLDIDTVDVNSSGRRVVKTLDQADQCRLAGAGRANQRNPLAGRDCEGDVLEGFAPARIVEIDVLEGDRAPGPLELDRVRDVLDVRFRVKKVERSL